MKNSQTLISAKLWFQWVIANVLGWAICLVIIFAAAFSQFDDNPSMSTDFNFTPLYEEPIIFFLSVATVAAIMGVTMGLMQWLVLRQYIDKSGVWILVTAIGWSLGIVAGIIFSDWVVNSIGYSRTGFIDEAFLGLTIGFFSGFFQWLFLQHRVIHSGWWLIANIIGWSIAFSLPFKGLIFFFITIGLFPGALTGLLLIRWFCLASSGLQVNKSLS